MESLYFWFFASTLCYAQFTVNVAATSPTQAPFLSYTAPNGSACSDLVSCSKKWKLPVLLLFTASLSWAQIPTISNIVISDVTHNAAQIRFTASPNT